MNALFLKFAKDPSKRIVKRIIEDLHINHVHVISTSTGHFSESEQKTFTKGTKFTQLSAEEHYFGVYEHVNWNELEPVDKSLLDKFEKHYFNLFAVFDKDYLPYNFEDQYSYPKHIIEPILKHQFNKYAVNRIYSYDHFDKIRMMHRHIRFWYNYIKREKIEAAFFTLCPHFPFEYIIYALCKEMNIPTAMSYFSSPPGYSLVFKDIDDPYAYTHKKFLELSADVNLQTSIKLNDDFEAEWNAKTRDMEKPWYFDTKLMAKFDQEGRFKHEENSRVNEWKRQRPISFKEKIWSKVKRRFDIDYIYFKMKFGKVPYWKKLYNYYQSITETPDFNKPYIYLPLAYQPELSTMPLGGYYFYQTTLIDMISHYLPEGWFIYVKEHIMPSKRMRSVQFYQDLKNNPKVKLISKDVDSMKLAEHAKAVATITGTPGWEGLFRGKPCLLFGHIFYEYAPGVFRIRTNEDCRMAIKKIEEGFTTSTDDLMIFMKALQLTNIRAAMEHATLDFKGYDLDENAEIFGKEYVRVIKEQLKS